MNEDPITDLRHTEETIRAADASAHAELRKLRAEIDQAQEKDITALAEAMAERSPKVTPPKARKDKERIRDIEQRLIPAYDESLWLLVPKVITVLDPVVDRELLTKNLRRWAKPKTVQDPSGVLTAPRTHNPLDAHRPADICSWVIGRIEAVARGEEEQRAKESKDARQQAAKAQVDAAHAAYDREQSIHLSEEEEGMAPAAVTSRRLAQQSSGSAPWHPFDRHKWLKDNDLLDDYGYVQPGQSIQTKGGREREVPIVPASEINASAYTEA
jgi:hypothetical protein